MKNKALKFVIAISRFFTLVVIVIILITISCVSCIEIFDRCSFRQKVVSAAIEAAEKKGEAIAIDTAKCVTDSTTIKNDSVWVETNNRVYISNINTYNSSTQNSSSLEDLKGSLLDILSKSDGLLSSNALTFCVTVIVSLLAALLLFRIEKMEELVAQNKDLVDKNNKLNGTITGAIDELQNKMEDNKKLQIEIMELNKKTKEQSIANDKFQELLRSYYIISNILNRLESIFNLSILINYITESLSLAKNESDKLNISTNIANLCSRLSLLCSEVDSSLKNPETKLDYLTVDKKSILNMYLEDILDTLKRCLTIVDKCKIPELSRIIENVIHHIMDIKNIIDSIEVKSE